MIDRCSKCFAEHKNMETRVDGGICYKFCSLCSQILAREQPVGNPVFEYLRKDCGKIEMTPIEKSMIEARIARRDKTDN